jgi:TolA-binding protein
MKNSTLFGIVFLLIVSCSEASKKEASGDGRSLVAAGGQSEEELKASLEEFNKQEEQRLAEEKANITTMEFDKLIHDFGNVKSDTDNECKFKVTNTGTKPLIISDVKASCGCTTPHKPEKPILPGKSDYIVVGFHPNPGQLNEIIKTVTVTANIPESTAEVKIRSFVK